MRKLSATSSLLVATFFYGGVVLAQLPPTNMGRFVHEPGDNQYTAQTQARPASNASTYVCSRFQFYYCANCY